MLRRIKIFQQYKIGEALYLLWALIIDSFYKRIPREVFLLKNTYDYLYEKKATFTRSSSGEAVIQFEGFKYRLRTSGSDFLVFNQIVIGEGLKKVNEIAQGFNYKPLRIVDCGANIGLSTLAFKKHFPDASIIAVEPEPGNFRQLLKHIAENSLSDVHPLEAGVWYRKTTLSPDLNFRDKRDWSFALKEDDNGTQNKIHVDTIENIVGAVGWSSIDILKIDIEGSEFPLFRNLQSWHSIFDTVRLLAIEVHEEVGALHEIEALLIKNGFAIQHFQELLIGVRR